jgi:hypothetical protein
MGEGIQVHLKDIQLLGFISRTPDEFLICANVPGQPDYGYYDVPILREKAEEVVKLRGITLPDLADEWNAKLNEAEAMRPKDWWDISFTATGPVDVNSPFWRALMGKDTEAAE